METTPETRCPDCGTVIPADAAMGLCPICLIRLGLNPRRAGKYELLGQIRSGMGMVYKARDTENERIVALKLIRDQNASEAAWIRFDAEATSHLHHPHIVPILDIGENYFAMEWMSGGNLASHLDSYRGDPDKRTTHLVEKIAEAVHHAHRHGILHRNLKPANILLDETGEPHVADFGVAKYIDMTTIIRKGVKPANVLLDEKGEPHVTDFGMVKHAGETPRTGTAAVVGTPMYMAPEQANGETVTVSTDVYSLGVILYELITGQKPFHGNNLEDLLEEVNNRLPADPRTIEPRVGRDLAAICLKCLEKDPEYRYGSAEELAQDLHRYRHGENIRTKPPGRVKRAWRWGRRHPIKAGLISAFMMFFTIMTLGAAPLASRVQTAKRTQIQQVNMNSAAMVAGTVLSHLRALSDAVERAASQNDLAQALESGDDAALQAFCMSAYRFYEDPSHGLKLNQESPFYYWIIFDEKGVLRALSPNPNVVGRNYEWRNYFKGAWDLAGKGRASTYVSRAFKGENDGKYKFTISTPILGAKRRPIGVLAASVPTAANLGSLVVRDAQSVTVLVAPRDRERDTPVPASTHLILLHPAYSYGEAIPIENVHVQKLDEASRDASLRIERPLGLPPPDLVTSSDDYADPVAIKYPEYAGRWLAGYAPVGNTGFVVIVQTREDEMRPSVRELRRPLAKWAGISATPGVLLVLLAACYARRRRARRNRH